MPFELTRIDVHTQLTPDTAANSIVTVPDSEYWKVTGVVVILGTNVTAGNRVPMFFFTDPAGATIFNLAWNATIAASKSAHLVTVKGGVDRSIALSANDSHIQTPFSDLMLPPGAQCQFYDWANIALAGDTVIVAISYEAYRYVQSPVQQVAITSMPSKR